ncbi:uncharacterized protein [Nicotiana sylvestris]|uniref:Uncharacterized protein LOC104238684 n=1 Tax=Nicotiana sylvestris TaxID=4096 RepID=A0A1U7XH89_NICSY|nr:PREDICTED: uncharacterized protein LOC104238684 [Nicotiana sylvestris]
MGNCGSCKSRSKVTAKLIHVNGELEEFFSPIKIFNLLQLETPTTFICNSDEMEFDGFASPLGDDDELLPGQLYFELPLDWLTHRLQVEDMATLAVKAIAAIKTSDKKSCGSCCRMKRVDPLMYFEGSEDHVKYYTRLQDLVPIDGSGLKRKKFTAKLSVILEE